MAMCRRQFWASVKLQQNMVAWKRLLSTEELQNLVLNVILKQKQQPFLELYLENAIAEPCCAESQSELLHMIEQVQQLLPREWIGSPLPEGVRVLHQVCFELCKAFQLQQSAKTSQLTEQDQQFLRRLLLMLDAMGNGAWSEVISKQFGVCYK